MSERSEREKVRRAHVCVTVCFVFDGVFVYGRSVQIQPEGSWYIEDQR